VVGGLDYDSAGFVPLEIPVTFFMALQWGSRPSARHDLSPQSIMIEKVVSPGPEALAGR
jgi:hypothetical protein